VRDLAKLAEDSAPLIGASEAKTVTVSLGYGMRPLGEYFKPKEVETRKAEKPALNTGDLDSGYC
jgi:hypothetical protein